MMEFGVHVNAGCGLRVAELGLLNLTFHIPHSTFHMVW